MGSVCKDPRIESLLSNMKILDDPFIIILSSLIAFASSATLPIIPRGLEIRQTLSSGSLSSSYACTQIRIKTTQSIPIKRCFKALHQLPSIHSVGQFHSGGVFDAWSLPKRICYKDCAVDITIAGDANVVGSWVGVKGAISDLLFACEVQVDPNWLFPSTRPGTSTTGEHDRVVVAVRKIRGCSAGANETEIE